MKKLFVVKYNQSESYLKIHNYDKVELLANDYMDAKKILRKRFKVLGLKGISFLEYTEVDLSMEPKPRDIVLVNGNMTLVDIHADRLKPWLFLVRLETLSGLGVEFEAGKLDTIKKLDITQYEFYNFLRN